MNRKAMERMLAAGQASIDRKAADDAREAKRKARKDWLNEPVKCHLCGDTVPRKTTAVLSERAGWVACKTHEGVS
ncbi:hypothetical protein N9917_00330 [Deltaproteobacteria bacterium]|nr:hypothetical protein [Deltaproteobacteria bacterium]